MTTIARALWDHWNKDRSHEVQVCIRGVPMPMRGRMRCINEPGPDAQRIVPEAPLFELEAEAQEGNQKFVLPITFAAEDVAWFSGGPRLVEKPSIIAPSGGGLSVGGARA